MRKKLSIIGIFLFLSIVQLNAQSNSSMYEFTYQFLEGEQNVYHALLSRNKDATGYIRISFLDPQNEKTVIEVELNEHLDNHNQSGTVNPNILCFEGKNPKVIKGRADAVVPKTAFRFTKMANEIFEPLEIKNKEIPAGQNNQSIKSKIRLLTKADLKNKKLISMFFNEEEAMFRNLSDNQSSSLNFIPVKSARMFLIMAANTEAGSVSKGCETDRKTIKQTFTAIAKVLKMPPLVPVEIIGTNFTKEKVKKELDKIKPKKDDIVVFYYSGHGFSDSQSKFPLLDLRWDELGDQIGPDFQVKVEDIYNQIKKKGARLNLVLSDCCNSQPDAIPPKSVNSPSLRGSGLGINPTICASLFLKPQPYSLLMTAAEQGEVAAAFESDGGVFTFNFKETLINLMGPNSKLEDATWDKIITGAKKNTTAKASTLPCIKPDGNSLPCKQNPDLKEN